MDRKHPLSRRDFLRAGAAAGVVLPAVGVDVSQVVGAAPAAGIAGGAGADTPVASPYLTAADDFVNVSRGDPRPHTLTGAAQAEARLTADTWRLEITADPFVELPHTKVPASLEKPRTIADGTAIDLPTLLELGQRHQAHFIKAMQCLNIDTPLGQGLWTGVPLRDVLRLCGRMTNVRRVYFWGYHNHDPKQIFKSSLSYTQVMETPPGELPPFLAYRLNGDPLTPMRGGPVRMVVPWSHGYKSIKWLQHIFVTNDARNNDTYAEGNNDPDAFLKTAAYLDKSLDGRKFKVGEAAPVTGQVMAGPSGVKRVEYWVRRIEGQPAPLADDAPELLRGPWAECTLQAPPDWASVLPAGVEPKQLLGFDKITGQPLLWPMRYSMCMFSASLRGLTPGRYEVRARAVDLNDFAQPEPRPSAKSGRNGIQVRRFEVLPEGAS